MHSASGKQEGTSCAWVLLSNFSLRLKAFILPPLGAGMPLLLSMGTVSCSRTQQLLHLEEAQTQRVKYTLRLEGKNMLIYP